MTVEKVLNGSLSALLAAMLVLLGPAPAYAINLDQAKSQGMVCELPTGYLKPTGSANAAVRKMVQDINARRKAEYTRSANENNVKPEQVGILTAKKLAPKCR